MSEAAKHTPGALAVHATDADDRQFRIENSDDARQGGEHWNATYVNFSGYFGSYRPELFAAAPDLLAFAEMFVATFQPTPFDPANDRFVKAARAAIAKATGSLT